MSALPSSTPLNSNENMVLASFVHELIAAGVTINKENEEIIVKIIKDWPNTDKSENNSENNIDSLVSFIVEELNKRTSGGRRKRLTRRKKVNRKTKNLVDIPGKN